MTCGAVDLNYSVALLQGRCFLFSCCPGLPAIGQARRPGQPLSRKPHNLGPSNAAKNQTNTKNARS
jgi:hypothetical protein